MHSTQICVITWDVNGAQFIRRVRRIGRRTKSKVRVERSRGKGDHVTLYFGGKFTIVGDQSKELKPGTFRAMCRQLGIDPREIGG